MGEISQGIFMAEKEFDPIPHAERLESGRLKEEAEMIEIMIRAFCRQHHHPQDALCENCHALLHYAKKRLACCPFREKKPTCAKCTIHCYRTYERESIRNVMRTMGPKMLFSHPIMTLRHLVHSFASAPAKPRNKRKN